MGLPDDLARIARDGLPGVSGVEVHEVVDSTNRRALELADDGAPDGFTVAADRQTEGRGRRGRTWTADVGEGLLLSRIVRPVAAHDPWGWLPLASAVAVARTLAHLGEIRLKWPNDVLVAGRKICGILVEGRIARHAVIGIGLNVNQAVFPEALAGSATSVRIVTGRVMDRAGMAVRLSRELATALVQWREDLDALRTTYRALLAGVGEPVTVRLSEAEPAVSGSLQGVDDSGRLMVRTGDGPRTFAAGDVTLRTR